MSLRYWVDNANVCVLKKLGTKEHFAVALSEKSTVTVWCPYLLPLLPCVLVSIALGVAVHPVQVPTTLSSWAYTSEREAAVLLPVEAKNDPRACRPRKAPLATVLLPYAPAMVTERVPPMRGRSRSVVRSVSVNSVVHVAIYSVCTTCFPVPWG